MYYKGPTSRTVRPEYIVMEIYDDNTMANVRHDSGHIYQGYKVANMTKYEKDEDTYLFEKILRAEKEAEIANQLGYYEAEKAIKRTP